ncbi:hypothetical protein RI367_008286 [Sorochytrium milnesiophthora]
MATSAAAVIRTSPLASHVREQVYRKGAREWGSKARLPESMPCQHVTFARLDTPYDVPGFRSADHKVATMARWKENFTTTIKEQPLVLDPDADAPRANIALMSERQFRRFTANVQARARAVQERIGEAPFTMWSEHLRIENQVGFEKRTIAQPTYMPPAQANTMAGIADARTLRMRLTAEVPVQGRILTKLSSMYTVGVGGVLATLRSFSQSGGNNPFQVAGRDRQRNGAYDKHIKEFVASEAYWDGRVRPVVTLKAKDRASKYLQSNSRNYGPAAQSMRRDFMASQMHKKLQELGVMRFNNSDSAPAKKPSGNNSRPGSRRSE